MGVPHFSIFRHRAEKCKCGFGAVVRKTTHPLAIGVGNQTSFIAGARPTNRRVGIDSGVERLQSAAWLYIRFWRISLLRRRSLDSGDH